MKVISKKVYVNITRNPFKLEVVNRQVKLITVSRGVRGPPGPSGGGGGSSNVKSGILTGSSFTGNPRTASILFSTPFADSNYSITYGSEDGRDFTYSNKLNTGFTLHSNAATAFSGEVSWQACPIGS